MNNIIDLPWEAIKDGDQWKVRTAGLQSHGVEYGPFCNVAFTMSCAESVAKFIASSANSARGLAEPAKQA